MQKRLTEDEVRDLARGILGFEDKDGVRSGVGQLTTFNQLGFAGVADKPDGWYLPNNRADVAMVLETKASHIPLGDKQVEEILKNVQERDYIDSHREVSPLKQAEDAVLVDTTKLNLEESAAAIVKVIKDKIG